LFDTAIKLTKEQCGFLSDDGMVNVMIGEGSDRVERIPQGDDNNFDTVGGLTLEKISTLIPLDSFQLHNHCGLEMMNVSGSLLQRSCG